MEYFDVLDEHGHPTGKTASAVETHTKGLWHRVAHTWFLNSKGELLLQKRSMEMKAYPGFWDISSAGHIPTGETSLAAAMREVEEELGLSLPASDFELIFQSREGFTTNNGTYIVNEHQDVFLVRKDIKIEDIALQESEVSEVKWVSIEAFEQMARAKDAGLVPHPIEYPRLIQYLSEETTRP